MSQYPQYPQYPQGQGPMNYANMGHGQNPYVNLLGPAKRAGILQIVLASLGTLFGLCTGVSAFIVTPEMMAQQGRTLPPGFTFDMLRILGTVLLLFGVISVLLLILGIFVIKGSRGATMTSIVLNVLLGISLIVLTIFEAVNGGTGILDIVFIGVIVWQLVWLFQANGAITRHALAVSQYAQYASQYYQQQQQQPGQIPGQYPGQPYAQPPAPSQQPQSWQQPQWPNPNQQNWPPPQA